MKIKKKKVINLKLNFILDFKFQIIVFFDNGSDDEVRIQKSTVRSLC